MLYTMTRTLQERWGDRIKELREQRGISVNKLSRLADIDPSHLWQAERGLVGLGDEKRIAVATALGVRVEDIFTYPDTREMS